MLAERLGYVDPTTAIKSHCRGVQILHPLLTAGGVQETRFINRADLLRLIVNSTLPAAEKFERWVFEEVLPSVMDTGSYTNPQAAAALALVSQQLATMNERLAAIEGGHDQTRRSVKNAWTMAEILEDQHTAKPWTSIGPKCRTSLTALPPA
jgi:prophage antirepressor-like protein